MGIESNQVDAEFEEFAKSGTVEVGESDKSKPAATVDDEDEDEKPAKRRGPPKLKEEAKPAEIETNEDDEEGEEGDEEEETPKPKKSAAEHQIERLKREKRDLQRQLREGGPSAQLASRLEALESRLTGGNSDDTKTAAKAAPDPSDVEKYPLGHLDDRYIEDKLEWLADQKATAQADAVLQRQQEQERNAAVNRYQQALLDKVDDLSTKGSDLFEDFQETVVEAGMRGDYDLEQPTFEACSEADNGAQILYDLSQDPKEAARVAKLSPLHQLKYVLEKDAEISSGKKPRTKPKAGEPPRNQSKGANSKTQINPATDNLNDFEKAWEQDEKKTR